MVFRKKRVLFALAAFLFLAIFQRITPTTQILGEHTKAVTATPTPIASKPTKTLEQPVRQEAPVDRVVDGDTVQVWFNGTKEKIRIIGINTPETVDPRKPVQCFGKEASDFAKQILTGQTVFLESDPTQSERDKYGRLLRYVFLQDGTDFGLTMIAKGYAHEYTYEVPYKYQLQYRQAEQQARDSAKGLWGTTACAAQSS